VTGRHVTALLFDRRAKSRRQPDGNDVLRFGRMKKAVDLSPEKLTLIKA
jgi:hypothetical protein